MAEDSIGVGEHETDPLIEIGLSTEKLRSSFLEPGTNLYLDTFLRSSLYQSPFDYFSNQYDKDRKVQVAHYNFFDKNRDLFPKLLADPDKGKRSDALQYIARYCRVANPENDPQLAAFNKLGLNIAKENREAIAELVIANDGRDVESVDSIALQIMSSMVVHGDEETSQETKNFLINKIQTNKNPENDFSIAAHLLTTPNITEDLNENIRDTIKEVLKKYKLSGELFTNLIDYKLKTPRSVWEEQISENKMILHFLAGQCSSMGHFESKMPGISNFLVNIEGLRHFDNTSHPDFQSLLQKFKVYEQDPEAYIKNKEEEKQKEIELLNNFGLDGKGLYEIYTKRLQISDDQQKDTISVEEVKRTLVRKEFMMIRALEERCPGASKILNQEYGIRFFSRYPMGLLVNQMAEREDTKTPYGMILYPESDWNGAFKNNVRNLIKLQFELNDEYCLRVVEAGSKAEAVHRINQLRKKYGPIGFALIGGHGSEGSIQLGDKENGGIVEVEDFLRPGANSLKSAFVEKPTIILASCSTGKEGGIGQQMATDAIVIAPDRTTSVKDITTTFDENGKPIFAVTYNDAESMHYQKNQLINK